MMSEEEFTIESIGMEESYCDHSCILRGEEVISDGIPSADARSIVEILNGLYDENRHLKAKASSWKNIAFLIDEAFRKCWKDNGKLFEENKYLKKRIEVISDELYCKDRKLEELGVPIECCDKK